MELTIHVPDEIRTQAEAQGVAPETYAERLVRDDLERAAARPSLASVRRAVDELRELRKGHTLNGISIKELVNEGRKY